MLSKVDDFSILLSYKNDKVQGSIYIYPLNHSSKGSEFF